MIRVYLDTNIFSSLKQAENKEFLDFLLDNKEALMIPFSEAHFRDIMKSYSVDNPKFYEDLELYDKICGSHLLLWENDHISPKDSTPSQYFESVKDDYTYFSEINFAETFDEIEAYTNELSPETNFSEIINNLQKLPAGIEITEENRSILGQLFPNLKSDSTFWELMQDVSTIGNKILNDKEAYLGLRSSIHQHGLKLDVNSGNWESEEVINKIDTYLNSFQETLSFDQFITSSRKDIGKALSLYEYFNTAYLMLDLIGYKSDRLSKPSNNMWNIYTDADHAFYAATCDYFICNDKNLLSKSSVLYHFLNIDTKILKLDALIDSISPYITPKFSGAQLLVDEISLVLNAVRERTPSQIIKSEELNTEIYSYLLKRKFLNIFNAIFTMKYKHEEYNVLEVTFCIRYQNYSRYLYYSELFNCISRLNHILGFADYDLKEIYDAYLKAEPDQIVFKWISNTVYLFLIKEPDTYRPILMYGEKYI